MEYAIEVEGLPEIYLVDTDQFEREGHGAAYIVRSPLPAIVETGLSYSAKRILHALEELEIPPEDVGYLMVTHIHLDHAGGAGPLAEACPNATVVV
ncbi:MAG: MBL fold metallo-hydrolase, partial [Candidatus Bipolaricaulia bacterium]